jgi:hypothetical protein
LVFSVSAAPRAGEGGGEAKPAKKKPAKPDPKPTPEEATKIAGFIKDLGSEKPAVREKAKRGLLGIGKPALGALREARKSKDIEVSTSAKALIKAIRRRSEVLISRVGSGKLGTQQITITTRVETVIVDGSADEASVTIMPEVGRQQLYRAANWDEFKKKHPKIWTDYADPALDEKKQGKLLVNATFKALRPELIKKLAKALGRKPTDEEIKTWTAQLRKQLVDAYVHGKTPAKGKPASSGSGPQLQPLE